MNPIELYQQVAEAYHAQSKYQERDRFLVLALDAASSAGHNVQAEQIRTKLLELNPNHLIKPYLNCAVALQSPNFITYASQLRKNFPPVKAQALLNELGGPRTPARPKATMLAETTFPMAEPLEDRKTPTWSQLNVEMKTRTGAGPNIGIIQTPEPRSLSSNDPLANVPMSPQPPAPFNLAPAPRTTAQQKPQIIPAPSRRSQPRDTIDAGSGVVGNFLFIVLFLAAIATLAYIFVLPFYPEVAKMVKG